MKKILFSLLGCAALGLSASALETRKQDYLLPEDLEALRGNYIRFWGPFWIAGREVPAAGAVVFDNLVPGLYTVRDGAMFVDGFLHQPGALVRLGRGRHKLSSASVPSRLVWGDNLTIPASPPPTDPLWITM